MKRDTHIIKGDDSMAVEIRGLKLDGYKGKVDLIGKIVNDSTRVIMEDSRTYTLAIGVGLVHGLKYNGSFKRGVKAGASTVGAMVGANIIQNVVLNLEEIKEA